MEGEVGVGTGEGCVCCCGRRFGYEPVSGQRLARRKKNDGVILKREIGYPVGFPLNVLGLDSGWSWEDSVPFD